MIPREINHIGYGKIAVSEAKNQIEQGNLFIGNTYEEYVFIHKIKRKYHLGTYSIISHDGTNCELPKKVLDELFNTILVEEGSDDFFYMETNGKDITQFRRDIVEAILEMKLENAPKAKS